MTTTAAEAVDLIGLAKGHNVLLAPFHNRRWDSDFLTVQNLLHEGFLGRLVAFESRFDRWRPLPLTERLWKENAEQAARCSIWDRTLGTRRWRYSANRKH